MGIIKKRRYIKCKPSPDGSGVQCIAYQPERDGTKQVVATAEFNASPDGEISTLSHDGDVDEIENLTKHAIKYAKGSKRPGGDF